MAVVVAVCLIAGLKQSRTKAQMKATQCACLALALVVVAFCEVVIVLSQSWAAVPFACIAAGTPLVAYCAAMVAWGGVGGSVPPEVREVSIGTDVREGKQVARFEPISSASLGRSVYHAPLAVDGTWDASVEKDARSMPVEDEGIEGKSAEEEQCVAGELGKDAAVSKVEPVLSYMRPSARPVSPRYDFEVRKPALEPELAAAVFPPAREAVSVTASTCEPASESACDTALKCSSEPVCQPVTLNASSYFERAEALRNKGMYVVASRLYAQCAEMADDSASFRKATLGEIACCVHADRLDHAKQLAESLLACADDLTPLERIKLKAVMEAA